jgi:hypothetical protein
VGAGRVGSGVGLFTERVGRGVPGVGVDGVGKTPPGVTVETGVVSKVGVATGLVTVSELFWSGRT